jgi:hypothetical protein
MPDVSSGAVDPPSRRAIEPHASSGILPKPLTSFIGRERELAQAKRLLQGSYLVTLTGPGGSGASLEYGYVPYPEMIAWTRARPLATAGSS